VFSCYHPPFSRDNPNHAPIIQFMPG
jgi:hypothetical protein